MNEWQRQLDNSSQHDKKTFHGMIDHFAHSVKLNGGLWGADNYEVGFDLVRNLRLSLFDSSPSRNWGVDVKVLNHKIWPLVKNDTMLHASYHCGGGIPFPTKRRGFTYVGFGPTKMAPAQRLMSRPCPKKCRPKKHNDWKYC